ncbi:hypothetical protein SAY86_012004 [Trapa natans]|uniref:Uncharacterized protein n=1 Tax=Trapa natans TaxID=22666 RepID=A0AAN7LWI3_TRANT|nr:hypothetical protein SAY86_012004 [Trapa natans]
MMHTCFFDIVCSCIYQFDVVVQELKVFPFNLVCMVCPYLHLFLQITKTNHLCILFLEIASGILVDSSFAIQCTMTIFVEAALFQNENPCFLFPFFSSLAASDAQAQTS